MRKIWVISGDISSVNADALITAVNSSGMWFGGIDGVINRVAGDLFHSQAKKAMPLQDGQTIIAHSNGHAHSGAFTNVVFVIDDLERPLRQVIYNGLKAASDSGFKKVSLPTVRMGVMLGVVEKSIDEAVDEMSNGVLEFFEKNPDTSLEDITFVVYNDPDTQDLLQRTLNA
jgi:O-acetyl-ADP-ribose deacetylase (regulator of RNase III)